MSFLRDDKSDSSFPTQPSFHRRLRLVVREEEKGDNLFARLPPEVAYDFYSLARKNHRNEQLSTCHDRSGNEWSLFDENPSALVSFLPLCVSFFDNVKIYVSYNGGTFVSSSKHDAIEIPRSMLSATADDIPEYVSVHALSRIDHGMHVLVEPLSFKDWELLEAYSAFMKDGGLLSQVSVVYSNQSLTVRINEFERVKIRVKEMNTKATSNVRDEMDPVWPDISTDSSDSDKCLKTMKTHLNCVLLIRDTEIIVEPKTRTKKNDSSWLGPFRLIPSAAEWGASLHILSRLTELKSFHVEPGCVIIKTEEWPFESEWAHIKPENSKKTRITRVVTSSRISKENAVLFIGTRFDLNLSVHQDYICMRPAYPREVTIDNIDFDETLLKYEIQSIANWNRPNIDLADFNYKINISTHDYEVYKTFFPVGGIFPKPVCLQSSKEMHFVDHWLRITLKEAHSSHVGFFVSLNMKDILHLYEKRERKYKGYFNTLVAQQTSTIQIPQNIILSPLWTKPILDRMKRFDSVFVIIRGISGSGKTFSALLLSTVLSFEYHRPLFYLDCKKLKKTKPRMDDTLEEIDILFRRASEAGGSIVVLDDLDSLSQNLLGNDENEALESADVVNPVAIDQTKLISDRISNFFKAVESRGIHSRDNHFYLIATCSDSDSLNSSMLKASKALLIHTKVPSLSAADRSDLFMEMLRQHKLDCRLDLNYSDLSRRTEEFLPRDFEKLSLRALQAYQSNLSKTSLEDSLNTELASFMSIAQMSNVKEQGQLDISWEDVGGLFHGKQMLESIVCHPLLYRRIYAKSQMKIPRGILLFGPPGCGKSFLVPALARECNYPLITCKGPEVLDKYIGASEAKIRDLFERASRMAPSILFLDELESLAPRRGSDSTGVTDRVVNQLLTFLDGVENISSGTVFIIGATSRPDKVDPAIIRPGRLERHVYIGPPNSPNEWSDLLTKIARNWELDTESERALSFEGEIVNTLIHQPRLCPADVRAAFDTAHLNAVHRSLSGNAVCRDIKKIKIDIEDLKFGFQETNPSLSESESKILQSTYSYFRGKRSDLSSDPKNTMSELKTSLK